MRFAAHQGEREKVFPFARSVRHDVYFHRHDRFHPHVRACELGAVRRIAVQSQQSVFIERRFVSDQTGVASRRCGNFLRASQILRALSGAVGRLVQSAGIPVAKTHDEGAGRRDDRMRDSGVRKGARYGCESRFAGKNVRHFRRR